MNTKNWQQHSFRAMGSEINLWLETFQPTIAQAAFEQVESLLAENEQVLSRFRSDSELSELNAQTGRWQQVSPLLWDVLLVALGMAAVTNGRFDPTILHALESVGYVMSFELLETAVSHPTFLTSTSINWTHVQLDAKQQAVWLPPGVGLDFGGIAKGYTAQQAVDLLNGVGPCLVDAGGDLVAGAAPTGYLGWPVSIASPWMLSDDLFQLWLADGAMATSGIDYRRWERNGRLAHHIIDPATNQPADTDLLTVTILADNVQEAEVWATAVLVAGQQDGIDMLLNSELAGLLITQSGNMLATPQMDFYLQANSGSHHVFTQRFEEFCKYG
ncbi:MAG: FAD:protein FMN transferase [Chloroflexi bacterium]|nr:MAG: FAD:protein FMN transferase [Chloroflexota bacterium]